MGKIMSISAALKLLARYAYDASQARFLLDLDDPHAEKKFAALQAIANDLAVIWPDDIETVLTAYMDRHNKTNGKTNTDLSFRYLLVSAKRVDSDLATFFVTTLDNEWARELSRKIMEITNGASPVPVSVDYNYPESSALFVNNVGYEQAAHEEIGQVLNLHKSWALSHHAVNIKEWIDAGGQIILRVTLDPIHWTGASLQWRTTLAGDWEDTRTESVPLSDILIDFGIDPNLL